MPVARVAALGLLLALGLGAGFVSPAHAQTPQVRIVGLDCNTDPEVVEIKNLGNAAQALGGWKLRSDPPQSESFDLSSLVALQPGESISIRSGPGAGGDSPFRWSQQFVFRDSDPSDYARLVDAAGTTVHQAYCGGPTPSPSPSPTPSPTQAPDGVPNGGGPPPPPPSGVRIPAFLIPLGAAVAAVGLASIAFPWLSAWPALAGGAGAGPAPRRAPAGRRAASAVGGPASGGGQGNPRRRPHPTSLLVLALGTAAVLSALLLAGRTRHSSK